MINRENLIKIGRAGGNTSNRKTPDQIGRVGMSEICSRMLEWKEMGFKVVKVTMSPRYIWTTRNRSAVAGVFR